MSLRDKMIVAADDLFAEACRSTTKAGANGLLFGANSVRKNLGLDEFTLPKPEKKKPAPTKQEDLTEHDITD